MRPANGFIARLSSYRTGVISCITRRASRKTDTRARTPARSTAQPRSGCSTGTASPSPIDQPMQVRRFGLESAYRFRIAVNRHGHVVVAGPTVDPPAFGLPTVLQVEFASIACPRCARSAFASRTVTATVNPLARVLRPAPVLRMTAAADCAGMPLRANRRAGLRSTTAECDTGSPLRCRGEIEEPGLRSRPEPPQESADSPSGRNTVRVETGSIAQAILSRRSATERRARACPWPRARRARYLLWLAGSRCAAVRAQW